MSALLVALANIFFLPFGITGLFALELITLFLLLEDERFAAQRRAVGASCYTARQCQAGLLRR